jgi:hypothetical protein
MTGNMTVMFIVGFIIFTLYLFGLVTMITKAHKQQRKELMNDPELKGYDWDAYEKGMEQTFNPKRKKRNYKRKTKV